MTAPLRILYVDDSRLDRELVRDAVANAGTAFTLIEAGSRVEFERLLSASTYDLILSDFNIAGFDGLQVVDAVRAIDQTVPIVIVTGTGSEEVAVHAMKLGVSDYVIKSPLHIRRLPHTITSAIERRRSDLALRATEEKLAAILNSIDNVVWSHDGHSTTYISAAAEKLYGRPLADFYAQPDLRMQMVHPDDQQRIANAIKKLTHRDTLTHEYRILRPDGEIRWLEDRIQAVSDQRGRTVRFDGVTSDISPRKRYEEQIRYVATHDALTGLANRTLLSDRLAQAILHARHTGGTLALLLLDLDRFKDINDSFGHSLGDELLKLVAQRLRTQVRPTDTVSRQGGDEFVILLSDLQEIEDLARFVTQVQALLARPFEIGHHRLHVGASIGVAVYPNDGDDVETLLQNVDTAMYRAKEDNLGGFQLYSREMSDRIMERVGLENALRLALERKEFALMYQPQIDLSTGRINGAEALIRWCHPDLGTISPLRFIPLAEEIGLIVPIGDWVLHTACMQNMAWQAAGFAPMRVSVNLSARQFRQERLLESVQEALGASGLDPHCLELELTESMMMHGEEQFIEKLSALKSLGIALAIDDFGTGYSNLSYLKRFSLDRLKVDQSFIRDLATEADDAAITRSVIALGHSLNLKVIAEGVETLEQLEFLAANHCDEIQGYYFSRPLTPADFEALLRSDRSL